MLWRINTGEKVKIWRDNWIPRGSLKPMGKASRNRWKWVSDLIEPTTKMWNEDLIRKIFYPPDAEHILQIHLPSYSGEDYLAWFYEKSGFFTVKSAYRLAMDLKTENSAPGSSNNKVGERVLWDLIWKANVQPKVRVFGWKLATDSLGVQVHRCNRNMDLMPTCKICGMEPESSHHAMVNCTKAKALRQCLRKDWELPDENAFSYTGEDWMLLLLNNVSDQMRSKLLLMWWRTWHLRNNIIFDDGKCRIEQSSIFLQSTLASNSDKTDIEKLSDPKGKRILGRENEVDSIDPRTNQTPVSWSKPEVGWVKLNWDASFWQEENRGGWGAVLRNDRVGIILTAWGSTDKCPSTEMAEAITGLHSLRTCLPYIAGPVYLENDCSTVIAELSGQVQTKSAISGIVRDIRNLMQNLPDYRTTKIIDQRMLLPTILLDSVILMVMVV
jgi:hypothetical protein